MKDACMRGTTEKTDRSQIKLSICVLTTHMQSLIPYTYVYTMSVHRCGFDGRLEYKQQYFKLLVYTLSYGIDEFHIEVSQETCIH